MLAGDEPPPAYLHVAQVAAPHLVIQQVAGQPGQTSCFVDRVSQPFGRRVWILLIGLVHRWFGINSTPGRRALECIRSWRNPTL
jgi:hypothetical protein